MRNLKKIQTKLIAAACVVLLNFHLVLGQGNAPETKELPLDKVVVTGTKFDLPVEKSGKTIFKLTREDIEKKQGQSLADLLNEVPGIQIDGSFGNPGTNLSYYLRGGRSKNTLILIDGVPLNDPTEVSASYDLRFLPLNQIESIEILKGGLSTLYGTGASAGVINIKLRESSTAPVNAEIGVSAGSYNTYGVNGNVRGTTDKLSYFVSGNYLSSNGLSAASDENSSSKFQNDKYVQKNGLLKLGYQFTEKFNLDFMAGHDNVAAEYDNSAYTDGNNEQLHQQTRIGINPSFTYGKGKVMAKTVLNLNDKEFVSDYPSHNKGKNIQTDLVHEHQLNDFIKGLWGVNVQDLAYKTADSGEYNDNHFTIIDPYVSLFFENNKGLNIHAGARLNSHSVYDSKFIYNINPSYLIGFSSTLQLKVLGSVSTSYITPSLYQLYSIYGNQGLTPEESLNYEGGLSLYVSDKFEINTVYFKREETNPIGFDFTKGDFGGYANTTDNRIVDGFEFDAKWTISDQWSVAANYTHAESDQEDTFYRIPKDKYGVNIGFNATTHTFISAKCNYTSARMVQDFSTWPATVVELDAYSLLDVSVNQQLMDGHLKVFGAINNILDNDFIGVLGFTTRGRNFNLGLSYNF